MIFLTVGTQFGFDRLTRAVDEACGRGLFNEEVFGQIGETEYRPVNFQGIATLKKSDFDRYFQQASAVISHAGMGTITLALEQSKALLVMPRKPELREVVNDHQTAIAERFARLGHLILAKDEEDLLDKISYLKEFTPRRRETNTQGVRTCISNYLDEITKKELAKG